MSLLAMKKEIKARTAIRMVTQFSNDIYLVEKTLTLSDNA